MAKKATAKKPAAKPTKKSAKKKTDLRKAIIKKAKVWSDMITESGLDVEGSGLLAAEFAGRPESSLADIWNDLESARSDLEAIIGTYGDDLTPSQLWMQLPK